ncbi:MAG: RiPP maturation radical SAM C-methyltransferase [Deltaproteobacteria bacterium]|nr:RiPP maturation radical SAM C-methyltransferase [Deltaproteobacteria bacterium]
MKLPEAECLLVVPPLALLNWPALGVHQLQACAREAGFEVAVLYLNVLYGALVGPTHYERLSNAPNALLLGDRLFSRAAFGAPPLGFATERFWRDNAVGDTGLSQEDLLAWEDLATALVEHMATAIADRGYRVVGATTTFDQTSASLALLGRVKTLRPESTVIVGGANCEDAMAEGIRSLAVPLDHVFSGESEEVFVQFLRAVAAGEDPGPPIVRGAPCTDLDALPTPRFEEYFAQLSAHLPDLDAPLWLTFETSRGCWWGQKHHCTFCGLNGTGIGFRQKSADRALAQLKEVLADAPTRRVCMTDNIMPFRYHESFVPRVRSEVGEVDLFYEQKANLTLSQVKNLWDAGTKTIQPGIEALDTELLRLVRKGVQARQNVALLRYARCLGMAIQWNLLWGLPGDDAEPYRRTLALLPLLRHLCPPLSLNLVSIDRFSPTFDEAEQFAVTELRPMQAYSEVFPDHADLARLAYHFEAEYPSGSRDALALMSELNREVQRWHEAWEGDPHKRPALTVNRVARGQYVLVDTREVGSPPTLFLDERQARAVLVGGPRGKVARAAWAMERGYAVDLDGWCTPLAVAPYPLLTEFQERSESDDQPTLQVISIS